MKEIRIKYKELAEEKRINIEKQLEKHLENNDKLKISLHALQRMRERGICSKHVKNLLKTKDYFIDSVTKDGINSRVSIISISPVRNKLHLKLILDLTNYIIVTAMVKKVNEGEYINEYERV